MAKKSSKSGSAVEPPAQNPPVLQEGGKSNAINRFLYWEQLRGKDQGPQNKRLLLVASLAGAQAQHQQQGKHARGAEVPGGNFSQGNRGGQQQDNQLRSDIEVKEVTRSDN